MHNTFYSDEYYDEYDSLSHYGVKGMRWGLRRARHRLRRRVVHELKAKKLSEKAASNEALSKANTDSEAAKKYKIKASKQKARSAKHKTKAETLDEALEVYYKKVEPKVRKHPERWAKEKEFLNDRRNERLDEYLDAEEMRKKRHTRKEAR